MDTFKSFVLTAITSAGVSVAMVAVLGWLLRTWISERLKASLKHEYDDRLEKLKAELKAQGDAHLTALKSEVDRQAEKLRIAAASFSEVQKATIPKKIEAVDALWLGVIQTRAAFPSEVAITDIFTDEEMKGFYTDPRMRRHSDRMSDVSEIDFISAGMEGVQCFRPHLGEYIWALYITYRAVLGRSIILIKKRKDNPEALGWPHDDHIKKLIASAFGDDALKEFEGLRFSRYQWLTSQFDMCLFKAIDTLLTGRSFSDAALSRAHEMEEQIRSVHSPRH